MLSFQLFSDVFVDDPLMMCQLARKYVENVQNANTRDDKKTRKKRLLSAAGRVLELVTLRHRLMDAAWESEVLAKIYKRQSLEMGYDEFHLYLRYIQFENAKFKKDAETARPPKFITDIQEDDSMVDK